jgi:glc operon protein GlcG
MTLTLDGALSVIHAAIQAGREQGVPVAAVVVDTGGRLVAAARGDLAGYISLEVAQRKATAAVTFRAPTHDLLEMVKGDAILLASLMKEPELSLLPGGLPIMVDGALLGGLGIAGGHYSQDQAIGQQALAAL